MNDEVYDDLALERTVKEHFGFVADIDKVIVRQIAVGSTAEATVFLTNKKQLLVYIHGQSRLLLSDVKKIVARMGLKVELYLPPKGQPEYFDSIGREKFKEVFPGRGHVTEQDIMFYRTLAPYNPALAIISEIKHGEISEYNRDTRGNWRVVAKFAYRRIKTS
jgi:hypothetical protein